MSNSHLNPKRLDAAVPGLLSIVIPAHNEAKNLSTTIPALAKALDAARIEYEIIVVNDNSNDDTHDVLTSLSARLPTVRLIDNVQAKGFGLAVRAGLAEFRGDAVVIVMADGSD